MFLLVGLSLLVLGRPFLGYPPAWAGGLILLIETAAMLAIAATLLLAFLGGRPQSQRLHGTLQPVTPALRSGQDAGTTTESRNSSEEKRQC